MKTYFISGHRDLSVENFNKYYIPAIDKAFYESDEFVNFVVGDCDGVDLMAQSYLLGIGAEFTVYHLGKTPGHFVLPEATKEELAEKHIALRGGFENDIERDEAMTEASEEDIAFIGRGRWTSGTAQNILRRHERDF